MKPHFKELALGNLNEPYNGDTKIYIDLNQIVVIKPATVGTKIQGTEILLNNYPHYIWVTTDYEELKDLISYSRG